jgi:pyruvate-formate lyase
MSLAGRADVLNQNFDGNESLQKRLKFHLPKFGNDIEWVDRLAQRVVNIFCDEVAAQNHSHLSRQQLLDAQKHPEKYEGLCIRVTGYSAYFVQMGKKAQDEVIRRTEIA